MKKLLMTALMLTATAISAQTGPTPPGDPVPVDASVWVLLTAGVGLAAYYGWRKTSAAK